MYIIHFYFDYIGKPERIWDFLNVLDVDSFILKF